MNLVRKNRRSLNREWIRQNISTSMTQARGITEQTTMHMSYAMRSSPCSLFCQRRIGTRLEAILGLKDGEQMDKIMVSDDAGQFSDISLLHASCWMIHEIRHYLELNPFLNHHRIVLDRFLRKIWNFYKLLTKYKEDPNENRKIYIKRRFNSLFSTKTGYGELDHRIALTK